MPEEYLTTIEEGIRSAERDRQRTPTRVPTDEAIGDPDEGSPAATGDAGAAAGAVAGTAIAGPVGMVAGAALGAAAGSAAGGDDDRQAPDDGERKAEEYDEWRHEDDRPEEPGIRRA